MQRCSFTPRFASKTIRSLAHFHDAGDEGNALVMIRRQSRRLQVAAIRGPRRKYFRWGKDVRPRKPDETLSRHGRSARRVAFLSPSGSPPKVFSVGQSERCSVSTVRRSIISMRDSNFIKKDEKYIPHFRRIALFSSGGGTPEGKVGGTTFPARRTPYFTFELAATSERVLHEFTYNSETNGDGP